MWSNAASVEEKCSLVLKFWGSISNRIWTILPKPDPELSPLDLDPNRTLTTDAWLTKSVLTILLPIKILAVVFDRPSLIFIEFYRVVLGFIGFHCALWVLLGFIY
jgi:hypothetical protein